MFWKPDKSSKTDDEGLDHLDALFRYAMVLTKNQFEAEDLVQETYLRSIKAKSTFSTGTNFRGWLFAILRNAWRNQLRSRRIAPAFVFLEDAGENILNEGSISAHERLEGIVEQDLVRDAIEQLPRKFREIILLREYEELSYKEIAVVLNCAEGTVMSRLGRTRSKLRELLKLKIAATSTNK